MSEKLAQLKQKGGGGKIPCYAIFYGNNNVNSAIGMIDSDGTSKIAVNGSTQTGECFKITANTTSGSIIALKGGTYRVMLTAFSTPTYSDVTVNANQVVWSYSARSNAAVVVFPL